MKQKLMMKTLVIMLLASTAGAAAASEIHHLRYEYSYPGEVVRDGNHAEVYAICDTCPKYGKMAPAPVTPVLSVRFDDTSPQPVLDEIATASDSPELQNTSREASFLFGFDKFSLAPAERSKLEATILEVEEALGKGAQIRIEGYTCTAGSKAYNKGLSLRRAKAIASSFRKRGFTFLDVKGRGECCPVSDNKKLNRRVEVTITSDRINERDKNEK